MYDTFSEATQLSAVDAASMRRMAKWCRFLAIVGFILCGFVLLMSLFVGGLMAWIMSLSAQTSATDLPFDPGALVHVYTFMFVFFGLLYFLPSLLLYQFASRMLVSLRGAFDPVLFSKGLAALRRFFKFVGILTIIVLIFYGFIFIMAISMGAFMANL